MRLYGFLLLALLAMTAHQVAAKDDTEEDEIVEEEEQPHIENLPQDPPPGTKKMSFKPPQLSEEQEKLNWIPDEMKCDGCLAVAYQFHMAFAKGHVNREKNPNWRLTEGDVIERAEKVCEYSTFEAYGITNEEGRNRIKGPGVFTQAGVTQMGGRTPFRLMEMCKEFTELHEEKEEMYLYEMWLEKEKDMFGLQEAICIDTMKVCRLQTPEEAKKLKKKLKKGANGREEQTGDHFEANAEEEPEEPEEEEPKNVKIEL